MEKVFKFTDYSVTITKHTIVFSKVDETGWEDAVNLGIRSISRKCIVKPDFVYISALNEKNALKKYKHNYGNQQPLP
jgi:hypothetical protein